MMSRSELIGQRFGRLTVIEFAGIRHEKRTWLCKCDCGKTNTVATSTLRAGKTKSCGNHKIGYRTHNGSKRPEYQSWLGMRARCLNPKHFAYEYYGGRGIRICNRWLLSFADFLSDMGERPTLKHTLERLNNDGNYEPSNCVWATRAVQAKNKRPRKLKTHCKRGHPLSGDNVVTDASGRKCLACRKILWRNWSNRNDRTQAAKEEKANG